MTSARPRLLPMCLALVFASLWLGCGPEDADEDAFAPPDDGQDLPCACGEEDAASEE